jgi:hypothetical protein
MSCLFDFHHTFWRQERIWIKRRMSAITKGISASQKVRRCGFSRTTFRAIMQRAGTEMQSSKKHHMVGDLQVDEFVFGSELSSKRRQ